MKLILKIVYFLNVFWCTDCYNIDVNHPIIWENPDSSQNGSYFGYSLVLYGDRESWIKVGTPRATYHGPDGAVNNSGLVYHCPFTKACEVEKNLNYSYNQLADSWTGGAMDISYKYKTLGISSNRWQRGVMARPDLVGTIFVENLEKTYFQKSYSPLQEPYTVYVDKLPYYLRSQTGFSLHFPQDQDEVLVGAPGVFNYLGTAFRVKNIGKTQDQWKLDVLMPQGNYYEYTGYALTSGYFYKKKDLHYVTGLPRGYEKSRKFKQVPYGSVLICTFSSTKSNFQNQVYSSLRGELYGTQFGEYFGSSLAAGDLNGDGLDDLIVGAPFRCNDKTGYNHGSVYVFYGNRRELEYNPKNRIDGTVSGGRFGAALMVLGDLDNDNFLDLAISAPNEETCGVVYIYTFDKVMKTLTISQTILGKDIYTHLKGFGTSFSRATDIDGNSASDFAVGSPESGHAVVLRSRPTVFVHASIRVPSSINKSNTTFSFECCYSFTKYNNPNLTIIRNLTVDRDFNRFYFQSNFEKSEEKPIHINKQYAEQCEDIITVKRVLSKQNYIDPINIILMYRLPEYSSTNRKVSVVIKGDSKNSKDTFCKNCPLLNKKSKTSKSTRVIWDHSCYHNGLKEPCKSKLEVDARFVNLSEANTFIIGSEELYLEITVVNKGDPAFSPLLQIILPNGTNLGLERTGCQNSDANVIKCEGDEVLHKKVSYDLKLGVNTDNTNDLKFSFNATTITENIDDRSIFNLTLKVKRDFLITGYSKESSYIYDKSKPTLIQNIYKIEKIGPGSTPPVIVQIIVPFKMVGLDTTYEQFARIIGRNETLKHPLVQCNDHTIPLMGKIHRDQMQRQTDSLKAFYLNCSMQNITCEILNCSVGPFDDLQEYAEISVDIEVDIQKLDRLMDKGWLKELDQIIFTTEAYVFSDDRIGYAEISNIIAIHKEMEVSLWILVGSAIAGLVILICVAVCLAKAGFFERKKHKMLLQLKEEALEEEKLIEEMIRKEMETGEHFQGDPMYSYIKPKELELYWKRLGKDPSHDDPLLEEHSEQNALYCGNESFQKRDSALLQEHNTQNVLYCSPGTSRNQDSPLLEEHSEQSKN